MVRRMVVTTVKNTFHPTKTFLSILGMSKLTTLGEIHFLVVFVLHVH